MGLVLPLTKLALAYALGVLFWHWTALPPWLGAAFALAAFAGAVACTIWSESAQSRFACLSIFLFLLGNFNLAARQSKIAPHDLRKIVGSDPVLVSLQGRLTETPSQRVTDHAGEAHARFLSKLEVRTIRRGGDEQPAHGTVLVATPGYLASQFYSGREVEVNGVLKRPNGPAAPHLFDYRAYLGWQEIYFLLQADSTNDWRLLDEAQPPRRPLSDHFLAWAQRTLGRGLPEDESLRLLWAMALGWTTTLNGEVAEPFMRTGTLHIFAISGLHITLISFILVQLLRYARIPRWVAGLIAIPLIWFYTAATGWQPSAIRSTIMSTVVIGSWIFRRPGDLLNSLAAAALIILLWQPEQLFQASFQLSFFVVLSMALLLPRFEQEVIRLSQPDPFLPASLQVTWRSRPALWILYGAFATSLASFLGSLPLTAYYFSLVAPVSLAANLIIVPVSSLALISCTASLLVGDLWPAVTELFNHASWFLMWSMIWLTEHAQHGPLAYRYVPAPTILQCVGLYGILAALFIAFYRRWRTCAAVAGCSMALLGFSVASGRVQAALTVLPSSAGTVLMEKEAETLLIDFSDERSASFVVKPFLHVRGIQSVPCVVMTMGDVRHLSGAPALLKSFEVGKLCKSSVTFRSSAYREFLEELEQAHVAIRNISAGDEVAGWQVLHPLEDERVSRGADKAMVLARQIGPTRVLLCSSLGKTGQRLLLDRQPGLEADLVIATPTGNADEPLIPELLRAVRPQAIVLGTAEYPANLRGSRPLRERLEQNGCPVFYTSDGRAVQALFSKDGAVIRDMTGREVKIRGRFSSTRVYPP